MDHDPERPEDLARNLLLPAIIAELVRAHPGGWKAIDDRLRAQFDASPTTAEGTPLRSKMDSQWFAIHTLGKG